MLTIGRIFAGEGWRYLWEQVGSGGEDYYLADVARGEAPGRWGGRAAEPELGLSGMVVEEQMRRVFGALSHPRIEMSLGRGPGVYRSLEERLARVRGRHEADETARWAERELALVEMGADQASIDAELAAFRSRTVEHWSSIEAEVRRGGQRQAVAGFDLTFSPPKSVSVLWAAAPPEGRRAIWAAHHEGVAAAMRFVESEAALSRSGYAGVRQVDTSGLITASFDHRMSRAGDVHIHTHTATLNRARCTDGEWRSLDGRALYRVAAAAGAIYDRVREMALERNLGVSHDTDPQSGVREIVGVDAELRRLFSARRVQIEGRTAELVEAWRAQHGQDPSEWMVSRISEWARQATRPHKGPAESTEAALARWDAETRAQLGRSLRDAWANATQAKHDESGETAVPDDEVLRAAIDAVDGSRSSWTRYDLIREITRRIHVNRAESADLVLARVERLVDQALREDSTFDVQDLAAAPVFESPPSLRRTSDNQSLYQEHGATRYTTTSSVDIEHRLLAEAASASRGPVVPSAAVEAAIAGHGLDGEQAAAVRSVLGSGRRVDVMVGPAGTGKTTTMGAIAGAWRAAGGQVLGVSIAENATRVLADHIGGRALNAAKLVYEHVHGMPHRREQGWWKQMYDIAGGSLVILDEAGMASRQIIDQLATICSRADAKLLLVGDPEQLDSPEAGGLFELIAHHVDPSATLSRVRRFEQGWERAASLRLRAGDASVLDEYHRRGRITGGSTSDAEDAAFAAAMADRARGLSVYLLADTNEVAARLAGRVRDQLVAAGPVDDRRTATLADGNPVGVGDQIVTRDNDRLNISGDGRFVANRDLWTVTAVSEDGGLTVARAESGELVGLDPGYVADRVQLAYAGTVHAAQGGTRDVTHAIITDRSTRTSAYVALTRGRAENHAYVVCSRPEGADRDGPRTDPLAVLAGILERPDPPQQSAALTVQAEEAQRAVSLVTLFPIWQDLVGNITARRTQSVLIAACGPATAATILNSPAWPTLAACLRRLDNAGVDAFAALAEAAAARTFDDADDLAAVLHWRLRPSENATGDFDETFLAMTPYGDDESSVTAVQVAKAMDARCEQLAQEVQDGVPAWAKDLGDMPSSPEDKAKWRARAGVVAGYREAFHIDTTENAIGAAPPPDRADAHAWWTRAAAALDNSPVRLLTAAPDEWLEAIIDRAQTHRASGPTAVADQLRPTAVALRQAHTAEGSALAQHDHAAASTARLEAEGLARRLADLEEAQAGRDRWSITASRLEARADLARAELKRRQAKEAASSYRHIDTQLLSRKLKNARIRARQATDSAERYEERARQAELALASLTKALDQTQSLGPTESRAREQILAEQQSLARIAQLKESLSRSRFGRSAVRGQDRQRLTEELNDLRHRYPELHGRDSGHWDARLANARSADRTNRERLQAESQQTGLDLRWYHNTAEQMRLDADRQETAVTEIKAELSRRTAAGDNLSAGPARPHMSHGAASPSAEIEHDQLTDSPSPPQDLPGG